jgi:hypothetical protein
MHDQLKRDDLAGKPAFVAKTNRGRPRGSPTSDETTARLLALGLERPTLPPEP